MTSHCACNKSSSVWFCTLKVVELNLNEFVDRMLCQNQPRAETLQALNAERVSPGALLPRQGLATV